MNPANDVALRAEAVRQKTLSLLKNVREKARAFELPEPPEVMELQRRKLHENTYQVLVLGEAKRGKSTFINALIGQDILPTDVGIATSQVFRICPSERESYRLRFEDESQQAITRADLPRYGSQVMADTEGVPRLDQIIRWIECDLPVSPKVWPQNIRVLDTPGLGALYAAHAQITHRFVPHADAVIFVLDSPAPISEPEIRLVEKVLAVTRNLFFIQTKIDLFRKEAWQEIQKRNESILRDHFKARLPDPRVWPISSTNLRKASETGDEDYLLVSRQKEMAAALHTFLFRVAGWGRTAEAIVITSHYHKEGHVILKSRFNSLLEESRQKRADSQREAIDRRRQFETDWGRSGQKRRELMDGLGKASSLAKQDFSQALRPGGIVEATYGEKIDSLASLEDAQHCAESIPRQVVETVSAKWTEVCQHYQLRCTKLLGPFLTAAEMVIAIQKPENDTLLTPAARKPDLTSDTFFVFKSAWSDAVVTLGASGVAFGVLSLVIATSWFPPLAGTIAVGATLWAGIRGWRKANERQLREGKHKLHEHLSKLLQQTRSHFADVDHSAGRPSRIDEYFQSAEGALAAQIGKLADQKLAESHAEINRLNEEARLNEDQRKTKSEVIRTQGLEWEGLGSSISEIVTELQGFERVVPSGTRSA